MSRMSSLSARRVHHFNATDWSTGGPVNIIANIVSHPYSANAMLNALNTMRMLGWYDIHAFGAAVADKNENDDDVVNKLI